MSATGHLPRKQRTKDARAAARGVPQSALRLGVGQATEENFRQPQRGLLTVLIKALEPEN
jgi:hypothetical protein